MDWHIFKLNEEHLTFYLIINNNFRNFLTENLPILNPYSREFSYPQSPKMCDPILVDPGVKMRTHPPPPPH